MHTLAQSDPMVVGMGADTTFNVGLKGMYAEFPERVINVGIAEQNMMGMAAGLAASGFKVYAGSFAPFVAMRSLEQFRTFIAYPHLDVTIGGGMGGISASVEGVTHQCQEDISIMRSIAGTVIVNPADTASCDAVMKSLGNHSGPAYVRLGKLPFYQVFDENYKFEIGKANLLEEGEDATVIATGSIVYRALQARDILRELGIQIRVLEMPCIKPLDEEAVYRAARDTGAIVTAEESTIIGALGSAVAEYLVENIPVPMRRIGLQDVFCESGDLYDLMNQYGMGVKDIVDAVKEVVSRKKIS